MWFFTFITLFTFSISATFSNIYETSNLGRIARGHPATLGMYPYMVRMDVFNGSLVRLCGAALIGKSWILTAAHCFQQAIEVEVYLGTISIESAEVSYNIPLANINIHPFFNLRYLINDIALVKMPPTELCDNINIVPLPKLAYHYPNYENMAGVSAGWGFTNDERIHSDNLRWGRMKTLREEECGFNDINDNELCVTNSSEWAVPCKGDSGGPLVLERTGELIGVVSSRDDRSCEHGGPAIYTRVTSYLDWIKEISGIYYS